MMADFINDGCMSSNLQQKLKKLKHSHQYKQQRYFIIFLYCNKNCWRTFLTA